MVNLIYKICSREKWAEAEAKGLFEGAPVDLADGFIHFSTATQVKETATRHFAEVSDLVLAAIDVDMLGNKLRFEPSRGGDLFPHLYGKLPMTAVIWCAPLPLDSNGNHDFPDLHSGNAG